MKREIKFRGKCKKTGVWLYGDLVTGLDEEMYIRHVVQTSKTSKEYFTHMVEIESIGQFIGVKDKNAKDIFEGDIVIAWSAGSKGTFEVRWRQEGAPIWLLYPNYQHREQWNIHATEHGPDKKFIGVDLKISGTDKIGFFDDGLEIIGNIHENPELLR